MAVSNLERVGKGLELLKNGLTPFVERGLKTAYGDRWVAKVTESLHDSQIKGNQVEWDAQALLAVIWDQWNDVFKKTLGQAERSLVAELRDVRNRWAHQKAFPLDDAYRALDSMVRLLTAVSAPEADEVDRLRQEALRLRYEEQMRKEKRRAAEAPLESRPQAGLKPWREIVQPHPDVASGRYLQAEFAADLWQVCTGNAAPEYQDPEEFFRRTYLTEGIKALLAGALRRLNGQPGEPVVDLQTNFGGGKTHSMLALYHLFSGTQPGLLAGMEELIREVGVSTPPRVNRVVLVGTKIPPGQPRVKEDGTRVRTLWGELAWQLGGREAYEMIRGADETGTSPGDDLRVLIARYAPCLILIDEWVAYARQLYGHGRDLAGGSLEAQFTFAQALTEAVRSVPNAMLVVALPVSQIEVGGEGGKVALAELQRIVHRVEAAWRPAAMEESFEIVRRRLFQPITDPELFRERDRVVRAFGELYRNSASDFPNECREGAYERRMQQAYPVHPELFERLYKDWGSLEEFQLTRGVLRLMAALIHGLWESGDRSLMILPAHVAVDYTPVQNELMRYLPDPWRAVIETDVDGPASLPLQLDRDNPTQGRYSAFRRVARTVFLGSAPLHAAPGRGIDDRRVRLGCVQPGESPAVFGDALRQLAERATHLYSEGQRYWFSTQPNINRTAEDRAARVTVEQVHEEVERRVRKLASARGGFAAVHTFPRTTADVPDETEARQVVLRSEHRHASKKRDSAALRVAKEILSQRGSSARLYANTLLFLAADDARWEDLEKAVRSFLAWESIVREREALNLDAHQEGHARKQLEAADQMVDARIPETYCWLLAPHQPDKDNPEIEWEEARLRSGKGLIERAAYEAKTNEWLVTELAGTRLRHELDRVPLWRGDHVEVRQLMEDFARYLYLPRLANSEVLKKAIEDGASRLNWKEETFAYADRFDEKQGRYHGLVAGEIPRVLVNRDAVIVKPEVAERHLDQKPVPQRRERGERETVSDTETQPSLKLPPPPPPVLKRFHGSVRLDATRPSRDADRVVQDVIQHLTSLANVEVELTLEIQARIPEGAPDDVVRVVKENCQALKFTTFGFEEE